MTQNKRKHHIQKPSRNAPLASAKLEKHDTAESSFAGANGEDCSKPQSAVRWTSFQLTSIFVNVGTLLVLVIYTFVTFQMWQRMGDAGKREEHFFRLAHRARLGTVTINKINLHPSRVYEITANFRNDPASLPAEHVITWARAELKDWKAPLPDELKFGHTLLGENPVTVVGPGASNYVTAILGTDEAIVNDIKTMHKRLYVYGRVTYTDAFRTDGLVEFCFFYWPFADDWRYCEGHNILR